MRQQIQELADQLHGSGITYDESVTAMQKAYLQAALRSHRGYVLRTALELGIHRNTLSRQITALKIDVQQIKDQACRPKRVRSVAVLDEQLRQVTA